MSLWFFACLSRHLARRGGVDARMIATVVMAAGSVWAGLQMVAQACQVGIVTTAGDRVSPDLLATTAAVFAVANLPLAVLLVATAFAAFRLHALPVWLGWISLLAAAAQVALWSGTVIRTGPLAAGGWLGYLLYPAVALWSIPTVVVVSRRREA